VTHTRLDEAFKALASGPRREILRLLGEAERVQAGASCCGPHEVCACKLAEELDLAPSTISHHMGILRDAGFVHARKGGQWVYYTLDHEALRKVISAIEQFSAARAVFTRTDKER
jgi:ArsR family transcriptional regulator, arsenate/arsenite/antimonite-responsive transcriptional repressor